MNKQEREAMLKQKLIDMRVYETKLYDSGMTYVAGVDEVGRGPLAGPVVTAAVILPMDFDVLGVDDSKKISEKKRDMFYEIITEQAVAWGIGMADHDKIDEINILNATKLAMAEAVRNAEKMLGEKLGDNGDKKIEHLLIDAVKLDALDIPQTPIVKGDEKSVSIAAASIIAKVTRDRLMQDYHEMYPAYAFDKNKGYGTKAHYEGIAKQGLCPIHRKTFCRNVSGVK